VNPLARRVLAVVAVLFAAYAGLSAMARLVDGAAGDPAGAADVSRAAPSAAPAERTGPLDWDALTRREREAGPVPAPAPEDPAEPPASAAARPDPFRPRPAAGEPPDRLKLIVVAPEGAYALVGDRIVERGDSLAGGRVTSIDVSGISLERGGLIVRMDLDGGAPAKAAGVLRPEAEAGPRPEVRP